MSSPRVALFTGNYNHVLDGVSLTLNRLVGFLEEQGIDVLVFAPSIKEPPLQHTGTLVTIPSVSMPGRPEYRISTHMSRRARNRLRDFNPDLVHIATPDVLGYFALKWALKNNKIIVSSYHTHFTSYLKYYKMGFLEPLSWNYLKWFYKHCSQVYVPSSSMLDYLRENGIDADLRVWSRGVDTSLYTPDKREDIWRKEKGFERDDIIVSFISRLVWEKNLSIYVQTVQSVAARNPKVKSMVVGDGPVMAELKEMLPEASFEGFVTGEELAKCYANSDIFLFPSVTETFGNVTLEAMASGLPCVVADAAGSKSLVDNEVNGYLLPVTNINGFIESVQKLADDEFLRNRMGQASRIRAKSYDWSRVNHQILSNYRELLNPVPD